MDMDRDLAAAVVSERCNCYDSALESIKKAVAKEELPADQIRAARDIIRSLGSWYFRQSCLDKILECYNLLQSLPTQEGEGTAQDRSAQQEEAGGQPVEVKTALTPEIYDIFSALSEIEENRHKDQPELLREAVTLLILKYSMQESIREKVLSKAGKLFSEHGE